MFITSSAIKAIPKVGIGRSVLQPRALVTANAHPGVSRLSRSLPATLTSCDFPPIVLLTQLMKPSTFRGAKNMNSHPVTLHDGGRRWSDYGVAMDTTRGSPYLCSEHPRVSFQGFPAGNTENVDS